MRRSRTPPAGSCRARGAPQRDSRPRSCCARGRCAPASQWLLCSALVASPSRHCSMLSRWERQFLVLHCGPPRPAMPARFMQQPSRRRHAALAPAPPPQAAGDAGGDAETAERDASFVQAGMKQCPNTACAEWLYKEVSCSTGRKQRVASKQGFASKQASSTASQPASSVASKGGTWTAGAASPHCSAGWQQAG